MGDYTLVTDVKMEFIANRLGEGMVEMPDELARWYETIEECQSGYVVSIDGVQGFLYTYELNHMGQDKETGGYEYARSHGSMTEENVFVLMEEWAAAMKEHANPYPIYLGRATGFYDCHEFCVFFPMGSNVNDIFVIMLKSETEYEKLTRDRWNSFYDLLKG